MKKVAGRSASTWPHFRELDAFAQLGTELDKATQAQLERGAQVVEITDIGSPAHARGQAGPEHLRRLQRPAAHDDIPMEDAKRFEPEIC